MGVTSIHRYSKVYVMGMGNRFKVRITANIATMDGRQDILPYAVKSLLFQCDRVRVYFNDYVPKASYLKHPHIEVVTGMPDKGAGSKFFWATDASEDEIYLSCDDDIIYPPDYVARTLRALDTYKGCIVTYHGRRLWHGDVNKSYYHSHAVHNFMHGWRGDVPLDTAGTGVMAVRIGDLRPNIYHSEHRNMADVLIGLQAAKQGVNIIGIGHGNGWFGYNRPTGRTIFGDSNKNDEKQRIFAAEIWRLKHGN
jgi:hypothetical protein